MIVILSVLIMLYYTKVQLLRYNTQTLDEMETIEMNNDGQGPTSNFDSVSN